MAGLQTTIRAGELPSFKDLCSTTQYECYELDRGDMPAFQRDWEAWALKPRFP